MIETGADGRSWLLSGPTSSYALRLDDEDHLLHLHWGPRITLADVAELAALPLPQWSFESPLDGHEEYPVEGGRRFAEPALIVRSPGARGTAWTFVSAGTAGCELRLAFRDPVTSLSLTLHYRLRDGHDVVERWATVANSSADTPLEVPRADSATWTLPVRASW
ncbi:alpha-galactosidase, partial [Streptomyces sp. TRM76130]|nr:alpha-galactosidase [Streptomyces sp. TRM76130]